MSIWLNQAMSTKRLRHLPVSAVQERLVIASHREEIKGFQNEIEPASRVIGSGSNDRDECKACKRQASPTGGCIRQPGVVLECRMS
jgi:hypothetical protein